MNTTSISQKLSLLILLPFLVIATGCATVSQEDADPTNDPIEGFNRVMFNINSALDHLLFRPVATGYKAVVPEPVRKGVSNVLANAFSPVSFMASLFQGDPENAGNVLGRFIVNSTVGLGGTIDVAKEAGINARQEDFGQTFGTWGAGPGFYLFLPVIGPSSGRDLLGRVADTASDPITWIGGDYEWVKYAVPVTRGLDYRTNNLETLNNIYDDSVDPYAAIRSLYLQKREADIENRVKAK